MTGKVVFGGVSTDAEVRRLLDRYGTERGQTIDKLDVASVCGCDVDSSRFKSVASAWRRRVRRDSGVKIIRRDGCYIFLSSKDAVDDVKRQIGRMARSAARAHVDNENVDVSDLSEVDKARHDLQRRYLAATIDHMRQQSKSIAGPKPVSKDAS